MTTPPLNNDGTNPQQPKKKNGCIKWGAIIVGILFILGAISALVGGEDNATTTSSSSNTAAQEDKTTPASESESGGKTSGQPEVDANGLNIGETFERKNGLSITVNTAEMTTNPLGTTSTCIYVDMHNGGSKEVKFNEYWDWKAQTPSGVIIDPTFTGNADSIGDGELAPNGTKSGSVCFDATESGEYGFKYEPELSFTTESATWKATL